MENLEDLLALEFRQIALNDRMKALGGDKYFKNNDRIAKNDGYGETHPGKKLANSAIEGFVNVFETYVVNQLEQSSRSSVMKLGVHEKLDPAQMGKIIIKNLLSSIMRPSDRRLTIVGIVFQIGRDMEIAIKQSLLDLHHEKEVKKAKDMLRRQGKIGDKAEVTAVMEKLSQDVDIDHKNWTEANHAQVGQVVLELFYTSAVRGMEDRTFSEIFEEYLEKEFHKGGVKKVKYMRITELGMQWVQDNEDFLSTFSMSFLPMVVEPKDWTNAFNGGYHDPAIRKTYQLLIGNRNGLKDLYNENKEGFSTIISAINNIQKTPFQVNEYVLEAVKYVHDNEMNLNTKGVPVYVAAYEHIIGKEASERYFSVRKMLVRNEDKSLTDDSKATLLEFVKTVVDGSDQMDDSEVWKAWSKIRMSITKYAEGDNSKKILLTNVIRDASLFVGEDIYFAYNADYRGRIYPLSGQFSPQGSDTSRGILEFANGVKPDSDEAIRNIAIEIANNFGIDKVAFDQREEWTEFNTQAILECAEDFKANTMWQEADKPFLFLAGCKEWAKVIEARNSGDEFNFISTMPCGFDGSCNGIQHYSAMFKDATGAAAVNLINHDVPADVYKEVAKKALEVAEGKNTKVAKLVVAVNKELEGKLFGRDVTKRSVMCLPYGVSQGSSNKYVYEMVEKHMKGYKGVSPAQAKSIRSFIGKTVWEAITLVVEKPVTGKEYFQSIAKELAEAGSGLTWFTPTGFPVKQMMMKKDIKPNKIRMTVNGNVLTRQYPRYTNEIDAREQANAIAPNFVHSFDSSHLQLTVNAAADEGMTNFLFIHDSFATDCNNAGRFNAIIREEFVKMYAEDHVNKFHDKVEEVLDRVSEVPRQTMGDFDMNEVLSSSYFFA